MDYRILYTEPALADLAELTAWSWDRHPENTENFGKRLLDHIEFLGRFPFMGRLVDAREDIRVLFHTPYQIYYRVHRKQHRIDILHLRHISRQPAHD